MITDRERKNREELFKLMQENPELPVVAMVDSEIVQDDGYSRWMGAWGSSSIEEYFIGEERIHFREEDDFDEVEETLTDGQVCYDDFEAMSNIAEEMADVIIMLTQLLMFYGNRKDVQRAVDEKVKRLAGRLESERAEMTEAAMDAAAEALQPAT